MDFATLMPGAPAVVKNKYKHTVPSVSHVFRTPFPADKNPCFLSMLLLLLLLLLSKYFLVLGTMNPARTTDNNVTIGICEDGLFNTTEAIKSPNHSNAEAAKKAIDIDCTVIIVFVDEELLLLLLLLSLS